MMATAHCVFFLLCFYAGRASADFAITDGDFQFIFHEGHNLLLTVYETTHGDGTDLKECYFTLVDAAGKDQLLGQNSTRDNILVDVKMAVSVKDPTQVHSTTLDVVRSAYEDRLADYHCLDKAVYTLSVKLSGHCPTSWTQHGDFCYVLIRESHTWFVAQSECRTLGGHLVEIRSAEENKIVVDILHASGGVGAVWLGLEDFLIEDEFFWASNQEMAHYTNWQTETDEPNNNGGHEDCALLHSWTGKWVDVNCHKLHASICQMP